MEHLAHAISQLATELGALREQRHQEFEWLFRSHLNAPTKIDLAEMEKRIMKAIEAFAAKQNEFNDRVDAAVEDLTGDVKALTDKVTELQNTQGGITPEDQALLDAIEARSGVIATKLEALSALNPPTPPTA